MALKAGYNGIKKSLLDKLIQMSGGLIIKSLGTALSLSDAGELTVNAASDTASGIVKPDGETTFIEEGLLKAVAGGAEVKSLTYTGDGTTTSTIDFSSLDKLPKQILGIFGQSTSGYYVVTAPIIYALQTIVYTYWLQVSGSGSQAKVNRVSYTDESGKMHITGANADEALNTENVVWTVYYL